MPLLKRLFWVYFLLLIFEGALRKWVLPQLSAPLLIVRDPIALLIIWEAYRTHKWPKKWTAVTSGLAVGLLALCLVQLVVGQSAWFIALFGLRSYFLPFPVAFIMAENLDMEDLRKFGLWTLRLLLPLVALAAAQYSAPPDSILNVGAYTGVSQIIYVSGHVRASSTFSFVMGMILYLPLAVAFILNGMSELKLSRKWLFWAASSAVVLSIPVTGSRSVVLEIGEQLVCLAIASFLGVSQFGKSFKTIIALAAVAYAVSFLPVFSESMGSLTLRFQQANGSEGGVQGTFTRRLISPFTQPFEESVDRGNYFGKGVGYGANAIAPLVGGERYTAGENDFSRIMNEFGLVCGLAFVLFRVFFELFLVVKAFDGVRNGRPLALFLLPLTLQTLVFGSFEQPTVQGFMVIGVSFSLAALGGTTVLAREPRLLPQPPARVRYSDGV